MTMYRLNMKKCGSESTVNFEIFHAMTGLKKKKIRKGKQSPLKIGRFFVWKNIRVKRK